MSISPFIGHRREKLDVVSQMTIVAVGDTRYVAGCHEQFAPEAKWQKLYKRMVEGKFVLGDGRQE